MRRTVEPDSVDKTDAIKDELLFDRLPKSSASIDDGSTTMFEFDSASEAVLDAEALDIDIRPPKAEAIVREGKVVAVLSNDPVAIASVAVDARVPPTELATELSEFRLEVKAGLSNLDKKMQQMLDGKQGDREEIAKVLAAVKAGVSRDEKLLAAVEAGAARDAKLLAAVEAGAARDKKLAAAVQRDSKKLDNLNAAVREGLQRDESLKKRIAQGLEKKSKKDFVRQTKDNQLEQFEVVPDYVEDKPFARGGEGDWRVQLQPGGAQRAAREP